MKKTWNMGLLTLGAAALFYGCTAAGDKLADATVKGTVEDTDGRMVANATVWLIPAADVAAIGQDAD